MILAIGVDAVSVKRFIDWHKKPLSHLKRIFSDEEITYCLSLTQKSTERFALRFAIREAVFKIITSIDPHHTIPFLALCTAITIHKNQRGTPSLHINWHYIKKYDFGFSNQETILWHLSCTHTESTAIAYIIAEHF